MQLEKFIKNLENFSEKPFNEEKLQKILKYSNQCSNLWQEFLNLGKLDPSPINFFDQCIHMGPIVTLRGEQIAVEYYEQLLKDVKNKYNQQNKPKNKYRLIWAGLPVWGKLRHMANLFESYDAAIVNSTYTSSWGFNFDCKNPLESIAKEYTELFINITEDEKFDYLVKIIKEWNADGVIFHHSLTCQRNCDNLYGISKRLQDEFNIPSITFEADHTRISEFESKKFTVLVEALLDQIEQYKRQETK